MTNESTKQSIWKSFTENDVLPEKDKNDAIIENLQTTLGISEEELASMIIGEHFHHQY